MVSVVHCVGIICPVWLSRVNRSAKNWASAHLPPLSDTHAIPIAQMPAASQALLGSSKAQLSQLGHTANILLLFKVLMSTGSNYKVFPLSKLNICILALER